jgi:hypothetical protein
MNRALGKTLAAALLAISAASAQADKALVIGINAYPNLPAAAQLNGCVADAESVAQLLKGSYSMAVTAIMNEKATGQAIRAALDSLKNSMSPSERLVVYFAGHGSRSSSGMGVILPSDAQESSEEADITADELNSRVRQIPAASRSVLLDSCFSGAMTRALHNPNLRSRYFERDHAKRLVPVRDSADVTDSGGVCYFTAARPNEVANETTTDQGVRGIFTYKLGRYLKNSGEVWGDVQRDVSKYVADETEDLQHPTLSSKFTEIHVFAPQKGDGPPKPEPGPKPTPPHPKPNLTIWDQYNADNADRRRLDLEMLPNRTDITLNDRIHFSIRVGESGYLVVLDRDQADTLQVIWPVAGKDAEKTYVKVGKTLSLPDAGQAYQADTPGAERIKAILFQRKEEAEALLRAFNGASLKRSQTKTRKLNIVSDTGTGYCTSDIAFVVAPASTYAEAFPVLAQWTHLRQGSLSTHRAPKVVEKPRVLIQMLRDVGGAGAPGPDGNALNARLSKALATFVSEDTGRSVDVAVGSKTSGSSFTVEGEICRSSTNQAYLCSVRMYGVRGRKELLLQLSGTAGTLRDLTSNLRHIVNIDEEGLIGEFAVRIANRLRVPGLPEDEKSLTAWLGSLKPSMAPVRVLEELNGVSQESKGAGQGKVVLPAGAPFRLMVTADRICNLYLIVRDASGVLTGAVVPATGSEIHGLPARGVLLPATAPLKAPAAGTSEELLVLIESIGTRDRADPAVTSSGPNDLVSAPAAEDKSSFIQVIGDSVPNPSSLAPDLLRLLRMARAKPEKWSVASITVSAAKA